MQDEVLSEIVDRAKNANINKPIEVRDIENQFRGWLRGKTRELEQLLDGRPEAELKADESRRHAGIASAIAKGTLAVSGMHQQVAAVAENRARRFGPEAEVTRSEQPKAYVPPSLREYRDYESRGMRTGDGAAGGIWVHDQVGQVVEYMRPKSIIMQTGARVFDMASDALELPKLVGSTTVYTAGEIGTITASDITTGVVRLQSHAYSARTIGSLDWFDDSAVAARELLGRDMATQISLKFDVDALQGDGTSTKPITGLRNISGITATEVASGSGNGGVVALADVINAIDRLRRDNAVPSFVAMHPRTWASFQKLDDLQERLQLQPDPTQESALRLFGLPVLLSSQISITETQGSNGDCSYIVVGDGSQLAVGIRTQNILLYDPYSFASTRQVQIVRHSRFAFNVLNVEAVEIIKGVRAA